MSDPGYERRDVRPRTLFWATVALAFAGVVIHIAVWLLFDRYRDIHRSRDARRTAIDVPRSAPPEPRLQVSPTADWQEYSRRRRLELNTYAWASREQGRVRIPIERAMELLAESEEQQ